MTTTFFRFFHLPLELRQHVYRSYLSSLTQVFPDLPAPAIFLSSRQLHDEAKPHYWQNTHFDFPSTKRLLDFLTSIDNTTLTQLRHISVHGYPFPVFLDPSKQASWITYPFETILPLFPGLQLSTFRFWDPFHGEGVDEDGWGHDATYITVEHFIKSQGFRELTYIVAHDQFMYQVEFWTSGNGKDETKISERHPQPSTWDAMMKARDGADSGASVTMYRVLDNGNQRIALETEFETVHPDSNSHGEGHIEIIIKRGRDADHVQRGEHSSNSREVSGLFEQFTWKQILEKGLYVDPEDDPTSCL